MPGTTTLKTLTATGRDRLPGTTSGGVHFGRDAEGGLYHHIDDNPYDGSGMDLLSAQPATVA
ncbi:hypothetical protein [Saccharothrix luteola]|uniref:hypothetical protein n=1 Tax=Saccharothrix luteola TaxID=2893018 RepID=UPI001E511660|nr:hypothetical protein [Saccharothrix luteola]MCC8246262.1 hypothetical protein [Saccharothrix luteola]